MSARRRRDFRTLVAPLCLGAAVILFSITAPQFLAIDNFASIGAQVWVLALLAVGQMFAVLTRGFDISVGSVAALSSTVAAIAANHIGPIGFLAGPLAALLCGTINGWLIGSLQLSPIVATLGMLVGARGVSLLISDGGQVTPLADGALASRLAFDHWLGLPPMAWAGLGLAVCGAALLDRSVLGRRLVMLGSNPDAVRLIGVDDSRTHRRAYQLCSLFAGFAGVLIMMRAGAGLPTEGTGMELQSIAAAVIGGTSLAGGVANVPGVLIGACFIQVSLTGLNLQGISPFAAQIAVGTVIIASGLVEYAMRRIHLLSSQRRRKAMRSVISGMLGGLALIAGLATMPVPGFAQQKTVGVTFPDFVASYWISAAYGIEEEGKKAGVNVIKLSAGGDANVSQQIAQIQDLMQRKVDAIIVGSTNDDALKAVVQQAIDRGIVVVGLASLPDSPGVASIITGDHYDMGRLQARCLAGALGGSGEIAMMAGPSGQYWADRRAVGFKETLAKEFPNMKIVAESRLADNRNAALTTAEDWVQRFPEVKGIYSATDDIAAGVITAYESADKLKEVKFTASNLGPTGQELLKQGKLLCTSIQPIVLLGRSAFQQAMAAVNKTAVQPRVQVPALLVTVDNIATVDLSQMAAPASYRP